MNSPKLKCNAPLAVQVWCERNATRLYLLRADDGYGTGRDLLRPFCEHHRFLAAWKLVAESKTGFFWDRDYNLNEIAAYIPAQTRFASS